MESPAITAILPLSSAKPQLLAARVALSTAILKRDTSLVTTQCSPRTIAFGGVEIEAELRPFLQLLGALPEHPAAQLRPLKVSEYADIGRLRSRSRSWISPWLPWLIYRRNTSAPASKRSLMTSYVAGAGPKVATIFTFLIRRNNYPSFQEPTRQYRKEKSAICTGQYEFLALPTCP